MFRRESCGISFQMSLEIREPLKSGSHLPKNLFLFASMIALQKWLKILFFHLKTSFPSQDI